MEIANIARFVSIMSDWSKQKPAKRAQLFFTPMEEFQGGNIFSKLSNNYKVIQPYLDMIDNEFIDNMNISVKNIALYVDPKRDLQAELILPKNSQSLIQD